MAKSIHKDFTFFFCVHFVISFHKIPICRAFLVKYLLRLRYALNSPRELISRDPLVLQSR